MKVLLLGGTGFIGKSIVRQRPDWDFTIINSSNLNLLNDSDVDNFTGEYDVIINSAGFFGGIVFNQIYQHEVLFRNLKMSTNIAKLVQKINPKKFVSIGSACIYPKSANHLITEQMLGNTDYHPSIRFSAIAKNIMLLLTSNLDIPWEYLILSNVYGPGERLTFESSHFVGSLINKIKNSTSTIEMLGTGVAVRDFMYIKDAAEAICKYCELETATCSPTNISTGVGTKIKDLTEILVNTIDPKLTCVWGSEKDNGVLHKVLDNSKMLNDIKFVPQTDLKTGLLETWNWAKHL